MAERKSESSRRDTLRRYQENVEKVRLIGLRSNLSEKEITNVMDQCMKSLVAKHSKSKPHIKEPAFAYRWMGWIISAFKLFFTVCLCLLVSTLVLYIVLQHKPIQYFIQSNLQDFIYPCMKILRKLFLPLISAYPSLTKFYDESCLIVNPYFSVPDMPCPCEGVRAILNLTGENVRRDQYHSGIPFVAKMEREDVSWDRLRELYQSNSNVFDRDAPHLTSSLSNEVAGITPASLFSQESNMSNKRWDHAHIQWRCNRMEPTRLLRSLFGAPECEPNFAAGVTIEKIVIIDGPKAPAYQMPTTDGTTVFIQQASGSRMIVLAPANECRQRCATVSIDLPSGHILWFSWWYWRASSLPSPGANATSIAYVGSYL